mgnify:CR=1 FL=1
MVIQDAAGWILQPDALPFAKETGAHLKYALKATERTVLEQASFN